MHVRRLLCGVLGAALAGTTLSAQAPASEIDAHNFAWATEPEIVNGLTTLGLDPRQIKYVVISHAHGDHDQGAAELQKRFGAKR